MPILRLLPRTSGSMLREANQYQEEVREHITVGLSRETYWTSPTLDLIVHTLVQPPSVVEVADVTVQLTYLHSRLMQPYGSHSMHRRLLRYVREPKPWYSVHYNVFGGKEQPRGHSQIVSLVTSTRSFDVDPGRTCHVGSYEVDHMKI